MYSVHKFYRIKVVVSCSDEAMCKKGE